ncbi:hypothetical protein KFK09_007640 [Dendrobium nobile]|uniref:VASt domain-containing protein n=1 Tax=Dendrobium nobile TaxID=94219 RepID=A0A8T3BUX0_DENNO|nr:hypothetical protein KFK09_007640 [Dendrobium nobile]
MAVAPPSRERMESSCSDVVQSARSTPSRAGKSEGDAASETSSVYSGENSEKKEADVSVFSARSEEYRLLFRLPSDEVLVQDFNCALQENILLQGHMYLFVHHICFYSNIFGFETKKTIPFHEVTCVRKAKTAAIFPNAIEIAAGGKKHFFGSFLSRDEAYKLIVDGWAQHACDDRFILDPQDLKTETSIEDIANAIAERERGSKQFSDDLSFSCRDTDVNLEECRHQPNGKTDTSLLENMVEQSSNREENTENNSGYLSLQCEDVDAPKVPENFTIVAQAKFPVCMEEFFNLFISDQAYNFVECFHKKCGDKDFQCSSWRPHEQFGYIRDLSFLHPVKIYLGAKYGRCQEAQKFRVYRKRQLVIETSQQVADVPYADYFLVEGLWDVQQIGSEENSCTIRVYSKVSFSKKTIFRGKIEQSTREECREVYGIWIQNAHELLKQKVGNQEGSLDIYTVQGSDLRSHISELEETSEVLPQATSADMQQTLHHPENFTSLIENAVQERSIWSHCGSSIIRETWVAFMSYLKHKHDSHLPLVLGIIGLVAMLILMQMSIIVLLTRVPEVHLVTQGSSIDELGNYRKENVEWIEKRFNYLKEEMAMVETRLEVMRHEHAILKMHLQNLERVKHKS